jgi:hypothetical protein
MQHFRRRRGLIVEFGWRPGLCGGALSVRGEGRKKQREREERVAKAAGKSIHKPEAIGQVGPRQEG